MVLRALVDTVWPVRGSNIANSSTRPPTFVAFVNQKALFHFSYQRYIENQIRENFGLTGTPMRLLIREHGDGSAR